MIDTTPYPLMTYQTLLPTDKLTDISFVIDDIHPEILVIFIAISKGRKLREFYQDS